MQFRCASPGAPCTLPRSSTAGWGPSERSSIRRGACRHRIGGAASQAFERGPASLRPQARYRASRRPWSAPVLIRRGGSPQALKLCANLRLKGSASVMRGRQKHAIFRPRRGVGRVVGMRPIRVERAVAPHRMHHHGQLARDRDDRLLVAAFGDLLAPTLDRRLALVSSKRGVL